MNLLIIGGTKFLGRHVAEAALARGHAVTIFHRGRTNPELFPQAKHVLGDRSVDLDKLSGTWDAVIDTCAFVPRETRLSAEALKGRAGSYLFVSSISVYQDLSEPATETSPVGTLENESLEEVTAESYGPLKALCESAVSKVFDERAAIVRPGLIVGPHDPTDRFTYWPVRFNRGGDVLVPDRRDQPVQFIDVRDLAAWMLLLTESGQGGTFNATGPNEPYRLGEALQEIRDIVNPAANFVWTDPEFLEESEVAPWMDLPLAVGYDGASDGMMRADICRAVSTGLTFRPLRDTVQATLDWALGRGEYELRAGLSPAREQELLAAYAASRQPV